MSTEEKKPLLDLCYDFFIEQLKGGFVVSDEKTASQLKRMAGKKFGIKQGSMSYTNRALVRALKDSNLQVPAPMLEKNTSANLALKIQKAPIIPQNQIIDIPTEKQQGALPKSIISETETLPDEEIAIPKTPEQIQAEKERYERLFEKGFDFIPELYEKLGVIKGKPKPKTEQELLDQSEKFRKDVKNLSKDVANYSYENNIKLPTWLEGAALGASALLVLLKPILDTVFSASEEKEETRESDQDLLNMDKENN